MLFLFGSELETFVEDLKKDSAASSKTVTLKDVEDGAFLLRQVGEAVATLKGMSISSLLFFFSFLLTTENSFAFDLEALTFTSKRFKAGIRELAAWPLERDRHSSN